MSFALNRVSIRLDHEAVQAVMGRMTEAITAMEGADCGCSGGASCGCSGCGCGTDATCGCGCRGVGGVGDPGTGGGGPSGTEP